MTQVLSISSIDIENEVILSLALCYGDKFSIEENAQNFYNVLASIKEFSGVYLWLDSDIIEYAASSKKVTQAITKLKKAAPLQIANKDYAILKSASKYKSYFGIPLGSNGLLILEIAQDNILSISNKFIDIVQKFSLFLDNHNQRFENKFLLRQIKAIVSNNVYGICLLKDNVILEANASLAQITGYSKKQLTGMPLSTLLLDNEKDKIAYLTEAFKNRTIEKFKLTSKFVTAKGKERNFSASLQGIYKDNGELYANVCTLIDNTEAIKDKEELSNSKNLFKDIFNTIDTAIVNIENGKIKDASPSFYQIINRKKSDEIKFSEFLDPDDYKNLFSIYENILNKEIKHGSTIVKILTPKGNDKYALAKLSHKLSNDNHTNGVLITLADISDLKKKEGEQEKSEALLRTIIDTSTDEIIVVNKEDEVILANQHAIKSFKDFFKFELKKGKKLFSTFPQLHELNTAMQGVIENGKSVSIDLQMEHPKGTRYNNIIISQIVNSTGEVMGGMCIGRNITESKLQTKAIIEREAMLQAVLDATPDGIYAIDKDLNVLTINKQAQLDFKEHLNINLKEKINLKDVASPEQIKSWSEQYYNRIFEGENFVYKGAVPGQARGLYENRYSPVVNKMGEIIGALEIARDLSELMRKEEELSKKERELSSIIENTPTAIAKVNLKGEITYISNRTKEVFGLSNSKDFIGQKLSNFIDPSDHKKLLKGITTLLKGEKEIHESYKAKHKTKGAIIIDGIASITRNSKGEPLEFLLAFNDVTEKVEAIEALTDRENQYRSIVESSPTGIAKIDKDGLFTFVSPKAEEILESKNLTGKNYGPFIKEEFKKTLTKFLSKLVKAGDCFDFQISILTKDDTKKYLDGVVRLTNEEGDLLLLFNDVTNRIVAQKKLRTTQQSYTTMYENMHDAILIYKFSEDRFIDCNTSAQDLFGYSKEEILSKNRTELIPQLINEISFTNLHQRIKDKTDSFVKGEKIYSIKLNPSDQSKDVYADLNLIVENENPDELYIIAHDKTSERAAREELQSKNDQLVKYIDSNLQLENFAYIASHDLKAPLRTVSSFAYLLKQKSYSLLDEKAQGYLDIVVKSSGNMQLLIDDLLAYSRVGTQKIKLKILNLEDILKRILIELNSNIKEAEAEIIVGELPTSIVADESMMIQIFQNLIGNAIKFKRKKITPIINVTSEDKGKHWLFNVSDNGIGIKEENQSKIFGTFEKLHSNDIFEGTGLGLSICQKITQNHGGDIWVESNGDHGSSFWFTVSKKIEPIINKKLNT